LAAVPLSPPLLAMEIVVKSLAPKATASFIFLHGKFLIFFLYFYLRVISIRNNWIFSLF
jgi:uncharacterized membrane protein